MGGAVTEPPREPVRPLPWVNPARCLPRCAAEPDTLTRLDDRGRASRAGKYRVAANTVEPLQDLLAAALAAGFRLRISSAFRSYKEQARLFRTIKERGRAARPGHSEHQLGTTIDLRLPSTNAILWLVDHAFEHGFALSYPPGQQRVTGYRPEPWHVRYVGPELARELHRRGAILEQLFRSDPDSRGVGRLRRLSGRPLPRALWNADGGWDLPRHPLLLVLRRSGERGGLLCVRRGLPPGKRHRRGHLRAGRTRGPCRQVTAGVQDVLRTRIRACRRCPSW